MKAITDRLRVLSTSSVKSVRVLHPHTPTPHTPHPPHPARYAPGSRADAKIVIQNLI